MKNLEKEKKTGNWGALGIQGSGIIPGVSGLCMPREYKSFFTYKKEKSSNCLSCGALVADKCEYCGRYKSPYGIY